jgi:serine-type D-Ala-D-Ala endopeptidase (penicillin-binding protein 7)
MGLNSKVCILFAAGFMALGSGTVAGQTAGKPESVKKSAPAKKVTQAQKPSKAKATAAKKTPSKNFATAAAGQSVGSRLGLRSEFTEVALNSSAVIVVDQETGEVLLEKNPDVALPIASITKVMTAIVTLEAGLPLQEVITITQSDASLQKRSGSRLHIGARFTRDQLLHLALMSSDNRAAHALGRTYPGGIDAMVNAMNLKAHKLGMTQSRFVEPTGLSSENLSTPRDLSRLVNAAHDYRLIRQYSTSASAVVRVGKQVQEFRNTNALARTGDWDLGLSKTGFIRDAGRCLVMQATIDDQDVIIVMLDAEASAKRLRDAERIRQWIETERKIQELARS